jgi:transcriptional regulator with XRE-family HTH domain
VKYFTMTTICSLLRANISIDKLLKSRKIGADEDSVFYVVAMPTVGDRIREIREEMEINQEQLAERAGLSKGFLSDVENGKRNIGSENLLKIANVLGASVDYLLRGEVTESASVEPVVIPPELSQAAEELDLSYAATVELLEAHRSVIARRSNKGLRRFSVEDWKELHKAIKKVFG